MPASAGTVFVNCATVDPALSSRLAEQGKSRNCAFVSAPVFGRPDAAAAKKCLVVASGPPAAMERVQRTPVSEQFLSPTTCQPYNTLYTMRGGTAPS